MRSGGFVLLLVAAGALGLVFGCGGGGGGTDIIGPGGGDPSTLEVVLTDHPLAGEVERVDVVIDSVVLHGPGGSGFEMLESPWSHDLLELRDKHVSLAVREVPPGTYSGVSVHVSRGELVVGGARHQMEMVRRMVEVPGPLDIPAGSSAVLFLDFDAEASIQVMHGGTHQFLMDPVVRHMGLELRGPADCPGHDSHVPAHDATGVQRNSSVAVTFPHEGTIPLAPDALIQMHDPDGFAVPGSVTVGGAVATFTPAGRLAAHTTYQVSVHAGEMPGFHFCGDDAFAFATGP